MYDAAAAYAMHRAGVAKQSPVLARPAVDAEYIESVAVAEQITLLRSTHVATGYRHVYSRPSRSTFIAQIGPAIYIGTFPSPAEAALAVARYMRDHHDELLQRGLFRPQKRTLPPATAQHSAAPALSLSQPRLTPLPLPPCRLSQGRNL